MCLRLVGRKVVCCAAVLTFLGCTAAPAATATFTLELSGMIAFAQAADGRVDVLLLNQFKDAVTHFPLLELNCDQLQNADQKKDCKSFWAPSRDSLKTNRVLALDRGYEVRLAIGGASTNSAVILDSTFTSGMVPAKAVALGSSGAADAALLRKEALAPATAYSFVAARPVLSLSSPGPLGGGVLSATLGDEAHWRFRKDLGSAQAYYSKSLANLAQWSIDYDPAKGVVVELWPFGATAAAKSLTLKSKGDLQIVLSNEPDDLEFCEHAPKSASMPFEHFAKFWELSKLASSSPGDVQYLPLPFADVPDAACPTAMAAHSESEIKGRRVNCMMVFFSGEE